jgi:predicted nuclease of predicted toxin-antitoxin system
MTLWIDAQLSPALALWINQHFYGVTAQSIRALGLRDATDKEIFMRAKESNAVLMSKDDDFTRLLDSLGPPPSIIWVTCGNSSNAKMREILTKHLPLAIKLIITAKL